ncbi:hypothetical protein K4831_22455 (plasmid) [Agrobacterium vitis]|nr:hypothetical protein [Agrobacterium tumefaciens]NSZ19632.1 hypothetical protein [Agrobacterium vitis]QZO06994.1 hypothetical protein K4831_22455 [Agrobacterium vitis]UJL91481.1 hypothetical protein AVF2S5_25875 [Agrobacterium vitis]
MSVALPCTLYSYLHASALRTPCWDEDGVRHYFYKSADAAREAVHQLMSEVAKDPEHMWKRIHLVRIEISALSTDAVLMLLNEGVSRLIKSYEIIETIDDKE